MDPVQPAALTTCYRMDKTGFSVCVQEDLKTRLRWRKEGGRKTASLSRPWAPPLTPRRLCSGDRAAAPDLVVAAPLAWSPLRTLQQPQWEPMELSGAPVLTNGKRSGLGRCRHFFWLGVIFDAVGVAVLFTGVFCNLLFYDTLVYLGSIIIFFSLLWWISWYTGNIELLPEEASKKTLRVPSVAMLEALRQSFSHRLSLSIGNVSTTFLRIQRRRRARQRTFQRTTSLKMTVTGLAEKEPEKENKDIDGGESAKESGAPQDFCKENLGPKPEDDKSSDAVGSPGPPWFGPQPVFPSDWPLPPAVLASKSLPVVPSVSVGQPLGIAVSQPVVSQSQLRNLPRASQTGARPGQAAVQTSRSTSVVQEMLERRSSHVLKAPKSPVTPPLPDQKLSQELPDTASPVTEATAPATQAQQSVPTESAAAPVAVKKSGPL
ncbi:uncharacterized protein [Eulemur rufifrons]|uniref:uncharacterized protein n=1 Tax=Eulemur rufifrons TaxID=859984 RepID=UPI0037426C86